LVVPLFHIKAIKYVHIYDTRAEGDQMTTARDSSGRHIGVYYLLFASFAVSILLLPLPLGEAAAPTRYPSSIYLTSEIPYHAAIDKDHTGEACLSSLFDALGPYIPQQDIRNVTKGRFESGVAEPNEILPAATFSELSYAQGNKAQWGYDARKIGYGGFIQDWTDDRSTQTSRTTDLKSIVGAMRPLGIMLYMYSDMPPVIQPPAPPTIPDPTNPPQPQPPQIDPKVTQEELAALEKQWRIVVGYSGNTIRLMDPHPSEGYSNSNKESKTVYDISLSHLDLLWNVTTRGGGAGFGSHRIGIATSPWTIDATFPKKVDAGDEFNVEANITYYAPPNMDGASIQRTPSPTANLIIPQDYSLINSTAEQDLTLSTPGSYQIVVWTIKAPDKEIAGQDITFDLNATGIVSSTDPTYKDRIGHAISFSVPVKGFVNHPPVIKNATAAPNQIYTDGTLKALITCHVIDQDSNLKADGVTIDLTSVSGSANQRMYDDGKTGGDKKADDSLFSYTLMKDSYTPGTRTFVIYAEDQRGGKSQATVKLDIVDRGTVEESPVFVRSGAAPNKVPNDGVTPAVLWTVVSDKENDVKSVSIDLTPIGGDSKAELFDDGSQGDTSPGDGNYSFQTFVDPSTPLGKMDLEMTAEDDVGHSVNGMLRIEVVMPPAPPAISTISLDPTAVVNDGKTKCLLEVIASDINDDIVSVNADLILVGGSRSAILKFQKDDRWSIEFSVPSNIPAGSKKIEVTVTDSMGATATGSENLRIDQSNKPPKIENYDSGIPDGKVSIGDKVTVKANVTDPEGKIAKVEADLTELSLGVITLLDDGKDPDTVVGDGTYTGRFTVTGNLSGWYNITIRVTDSAGAEATVKVRVEVIPPGKEITGIPQAVYIGAPIGIVLLILVLIVVSTVLSGKRRETPMPSNQPQVFRPMGQGPSRFMPVAGQGPR
jgi:hypothetical protein